MAGEGPENPCQKHAMMIMVYDVLLEECCPIKESIFGLTYIYIYIYIYTDTHTNSQTHTHTHTHTHTYIYIYIYMFVVGPKKE